MKIFTWEIHWLDIETEEVQVAATSLQDARERVAREIGGGWFNDPKEGKLVLDFVNDVEPSSEPVETFIRIIF